MANRLLPLLRAPGAETAVLRLAGFIFMAAIVLMALAALQRHEPLASHLTAWDEAAWWLTLSLGLLGPPPPARRRDREEGCIRDPRSGATDRRRACSRAALSQATPGR
jgi:hypothetical protein